MTYTGAKYEAKTYQTAAEIAKLIRADIKAAIAADDLPGTARNYSVRIDNFSGGRSIRIAAKGLDGVWETCKGLAATGCNHWGCEHGRQTEVLTSEGQRIEKLLQSFHNAYNYDHGDSMTDYFNVNYYGSAHVEH